MRLLSVFVYLCYKFLPHPRESLYEYTFHCINILNLISGRRRLIIARIKQKQRFTLLTSPMIYAIIQTTVNRGSPPWDFLKTARGLISSAIKGPRAGEEACEPKIMNQSFCRNESECDEIFWEYLVLPWILCIFNVNFICF